MSYKLIIKIGLLPMLCLILIYFSKVYIDFQDIITFAVLIIVFNKNKTRKNFTLSLLYSIIFSFLVLILSMGVGKIIIEIKDEAFVNSVSNTYLKQFHIIPKSIVSPLLMFYVYKLLFDIKTTRYSKVIKWVAIIVLCILGMTGLFLTNLYLFMSWQFVMALSLQLIIYQKEVTMVYKKE